MADRTFLPVKIARRRLEILDKVRTFFRSRDLLEVETPVLSRGISTDCHIDVFSSEFFPSGYGTPGQGKQYYLQTSPEFHMKRMLAEGYPDIFQISRVFRNGELGSRHNPEFTMIEWYRRNFTMNMLIEEVADLCRSILGRIQVLTMSYRDLFTGCGAPDPLEATTEELFAFCKSFDSCAPAFTMRSDALNYVLSGFVEPGIPHECMVFVHNFPSDQAFLAMVDQADPRTARRFECYYKGLELCNGYEELADSSENERRMNEQNEIRKTMKKPALPANQPFIEALQKGIPPCAGVALGLDRLVMVALGASSIDEVVAFPWEQA